MNPALSLEGVGSKVQQRMSMHLNAFELEFEIIYSLASEVYHAIVIRL